MGRSTTVAAHDRIGANGKRQHVGRHKRKLISGARAWAFAKKAAKHGTRKQWAKAAACGTAAAAIGGAWATGGVSRAALTTVAGVLAVGGVLAGRAAVRSARRSYAVHRHLKAQERLAAHGPIQPTRSERAAHSARRFTRAVRATRPDRSTQ